MYNHVRVGTFHLRSREYEYLRHAPNPYITINHPVCYNRNNDIDILYAVHVKIFVYIVFQIFPKMTVPSNSKAVGMLHPKLIREMIGLPKGNVKDKVRLQMIE